MLKLIFSVGLYLVLQVNGIACQCNGTKDPFLKVSKTVPFIALIKVTNYLTFENLRGLNDTSPIPMSMEVEIIDIFKGKEDKKKSTVWGNPGYLCRPYLSAFAKGQYYVIAFTPAGFAPPEKDTDYTINSCGTYWLPVDMNKLTVTGNIESKDQTNTTMGLSALKLKLAEISTHNDKGSTVKR